MRRVPYFATLLAFLTLSLSTAAAGDDLPYLGHWSNGRGETLVITKKTLQFAEDKPVPYRDVTRGTDDSIFELQITVGGEVNAFSGRTLALILEGESMRMIGYRTHADYMQEKDPQQTVNWEKDAE